MLNKLLLFLFFFMGASLIFSNDVKYLTAGSFGYKADYVSQKNIIDEANILKKDENFISIVVLKVNQNDWGIQFLYISNSKNGKEMILKIRDEIAIKYGGKKVISRSGVTTRPLNDDEFYPIVLQKEFKKNKK
mgnify:CR=1 FL=1